jgi:hypothetical protein
MDMMSFLFIAGLDFPGPDFSGFDFAATVAPRGETGAVEKNVPHGIVGEHATRAGAGRLKNLT